MASASSNGTVTFSGHGQAGNWSDPANWTGGVLPSTTSGLGLLTMSATLNNSFTAYQVMALGNEQITINGTLNTLSTNLCNSFMVCDNAVATFNPTAVLNDAGGMIVGRDAPGTLHVLGSGSQHAVINSRDGKIGQHQNSVGVMTVDDAVWHVSDRMFVGLSGIGNLTESHASTVTVANCFGIGGNLGGTGHVTLSDASTLSVGTFAVIGGNGIDTDTPAPAGTGTGIGTLTVQSGSAFSVVYSLKMGAGSAINLAGGSVSVANGFPGLMMGTGATISGNGTVSVGAGVQNSVGITDGGTITASGGTLVLNSSITGTGAVRIGAGSTLAITGHGIGVPSIAFAGSNGVLSLATGVADHAVITGFGMGDSIVMAGVDHIGWNASTDVLTLSSGTHVVDQLQFTGTYAAGDFTLSQGSAGAVIGLVPHSTAIAH